MLNSPGKNVPSDEYVIAHADKTVLKIHGLKIKGLNARALEEALTSRLQSTVRVIGVTGSSIEMDVYGLDEENILKDEAGIIRTISLSEGITAAEIAKIASAKKAVPVNFNEIFNNPGSYPAGCAKEKWLKNCE